MKKRLEIKFIFAITVIISFFSLTVLVSPNKAEAAPNLLSWDLVDSNKGLEYGGSTKYLSSVRAGAATWNAYKKYVISADTIYTIEDVTLSDFSQVSNVMGQTSPIGILRFNTYNMDCYGPTTQQNVATHELGHALGIDHNSPGVMEPYSSTQTSLSSTDKWAYDLAYARY